MTCMRPAALCCAPDPTPCATLCAAGAHRPSWLSAVLPLKQAKQSQTAFCVELGLEWHASKWAALRVLKHFGLGPTS